MPDSGASALTGKRVVVTRAAAQSSELTQQLSTLGVDASVFPLVAFAPPEDFAPLDAGLKNLGTFDWLIFTSANAVDAVVDRMAALKLSFETVGKPRQVAAVGPTTAHYAEQMGFIVAYSAKTHSGSALANELGESVRDKRVFLPRSNRANPDLPKILKQNGAQVSEAVAYRTLPPPAVKAAEFVSFNLGQVDAILFFSPTAVEHFVEFATAAKLLSLQQKLAVVAVGPITAAALRKAGLSEIIVAADTTSEAVVSALENYFSATKNTSSAGANRG